MHIHPIINVQVIKRIDVARAIINIITIINIIKKKKIQEMIFKLRYN